jgi:hypothetical protein
MTTSHLLCRRRRRRRLFVCSCCCRFHVDIYSLNIEYRISNGDDEEEEEDQEVETIRFGFWSVVEGECFEREFERDSS